MVAVGLGLAGNVTDAIVSIGDNEGVADDEYITDRSRSKIRSVYGKAFKARVTIAFIVNGDGEFREWWWW